MSSPRQYQVLSRYKPQNVTASELQKMGVREEIPRGTRVGPLNRSDIPDPRPKSPITGRRALKVGDVGWGLQYAEPNFNLRPGTPSSPTVDKRYHKKNGMAMNSRVADTNHMHMRLPGATMCANVTPYL